MTQKTEPNTEQNVLLSPVGIKDFTQNAHLAREYLAALNFIKALDKARLDPKKTIAILRNLTEQGN